MSAWFTKSQAIYLLDLGKCAKTRKNTKVWSATVNSIFLFALHIIQSNKYVKLERNLFMRPWRKLSDKVRCKRGFGNDTHKNIYLHIHVKAKYLKHCDIHTKVGFTTPYDRESSIQFNFHMSKHLLHFIPRDFCHI